MKHCLPREWIRYEWRRISSFGPEQIPSEPASLKTQIYTSPTACLCSHGWQPPAQELQMTRHLINHCEYKKRHLQSTGQIVLSSVALNHPHKFYLQSLLLVRVKSRELHTLDVAECGRILPKPALTTSHFPSAYPSHRSRDIVNIVPRTLIPRALKSPFAPCLIPVH